MGLLFWKKKEKAESEKPISTELEVPAPPESKKELPPFIPEIKAIKEAVEPAPPPAAVETTEEEELKLARKTLEKKARRGEGPIFVKVSDFRNVLDELGLIKSALKESNDIITRTLQFKEDEDAAYSKWQKTINEINRNLLFIEKTLFEQKVR